MCGTRRDDLVNTRFSITTYGEVAAGYPSEVALRKLAEDYPDDIQWMEQIEKKRGDLFRIYFHRVVLDEAHYIKNRSTQSQYSYLSCPRAAYRISRRRIDH